MVDLVQLYAQIDDTTLETMTSKGILRRAAADAAKVRFDSTGPDEIVGTIDDATVRLDAKGLAKARCTCPSAALCRHRLAVVLALRNATPTPAEAVKEATIDWPARLAVFDFPALQKAVGKTALREALRLVALAESTKADAGTATLKIALTRAGDVVDVAIPAQGDFSTIASNLPERRRPAHHAAAVIAARNHFGLPPIELEESEAAGSDAFAPDGALLAAVRDALQQAYAQAFAIPARALEERLTLLAISGRAEAMPRLSSCLRRVAEGLEQRRTRNVNHDAVALLRDMAFGHALAYALSRPGDEKRLRKLAGAVRAEYEPIGDVDLIGLGASLFETISGALGVTGHFVEASTGRCFTASLARNTTHDTRFDPREAYGREPIWSHPLSRLSTAAFALKGAQASATGRLSLSQASRTGALEAFRPTRELLITWMQNAEGTPADLAYMSWPALADQLGGWFAPALDALQAPVRPVVLVPQRITPIVFDDLTQSLRWPLMDRSGHWLSLTLDHDDEGRGYGARRIIALEEAMRDQGSKMPFAIVALARVADGRIVLEPMALWGDQQFLLDFPQRGRQTESGMMGKLMSSLRRASAQFAPSPPQDTSQRQTARLLETGVDALIGSAEASLGSDAREKLLSPLSRNYEAASLGTLASLIDRVRVGEPNDVSNAALIAAHGLFTTQALCYRLPVWR